MPYVSLEDAAQNGWEVERQYLCQAHGDKNASASLNMSGYYFCYACGDRGKLDMSKVIVTPQGVSRLVKRVNEKLYPTHKTYSERWLDVFDSDGPGDYWLSRFSAETCKHYRLGRTSERSTYPMRGTEGEIFGVVYRNLDRTPKYQYPYGVKVGDHLFDIHRLVSEDLVLTEGATDAMACWEVGVPAGTSSYRNGLTKAQVSLIARYNPRVLWIAYDMDRGGLSGYRSVRRSLADVGVTVRRLEWGHGKDLASLEHDHRKEVLKSVCVSRT